MKIFEEKKLNTLDLKNRFVMPPMCMYIAEDGIPNEFHMAHYTSHAIGQVGLIIVEATGVVPEGRITDQCLGLWNDEQMEAFKPIVKAVKKQGSKIGIQLNHAGRKTRTEAGIIKAPSAIAFSERLKTPDEMTQSEIKTMINDFKAASIRADQAGFDLIEIHMAHGYLLNSFLSPLSNQRTDKYHDAKVLYKELMDEVRSVWPKDKALIIRVSATDYSSYGVKEVYESIEPFLDMIDAIHVSSGGITPTKPHDYPGYQVGYASELKALTNKNVIAVGMIDTIEQAIEVIENDRADFVALGRALLRNPHFILESLHRYGQKEKIPFSYQRGFKD